ncbi:MAG: allophanate hydrolase [Pseudomonadota bacterium]
MTVNLNGLSLGIGSLRQHYLNGDFTPRDLLDALRAKAATYAEYGIWIHQLTESEVAPYLAALEQRAIADLPLYGIPFAIKDNIDLAGIPTTAACAAFAYTPQDSAFVVRRLLDAGAIPVGKTNLDQFATGLVGVRSPYGVCRNSFDPEMISGGSSSGSAVAVALGLASFALGSDTAGSGRIPACFNNLVGFKPSLGLVSTTGLVPACRSLDCVSLFTLTADDANTVFSYAEGEDSADCYSRANPFSNSKRHYGTHEGSLRVGVPAKDQLEFFGHRGYEQAWQAALQQLQDRGVDVFEIDFSAFMEAARTLYEGPWVAERYITASDLINNQPDALLDVTRIIIERGKEVSGVDSFAAQYRLKSLRKQAQKILERIDCLLTPTAGRPYRIAEVLANPIELNSNLGYYTNYMNLFDLTAVAVPTGFTDSGFPFGVTLAAERDSDRLLLSIAKRMQGIFQVHLAREPGVADTGISMPSAEQRHVSVAVCGAHLEGQPLNWQLTERGGVLKERTVSAPRYHLYALAGGKIMRPAMMLANDSSGRAIEVEVWSLPASEFGSFVAAIPPPLGIGKVILANNTQVPGFICEVSGLVGAQDITQFGSWRAYLRHLAEPIKCDVPA